MTQSNDTKNVLEFMFRESFQDRKLWLALSLITLNQACLGMGVAYFFSQIFGKLAANETEQIPMLVAALVITAITAIVANRIGFRMLLRLQADTTHRVQNKVLDALLKKSQTFFANNMSGKIISDGISMDSAIIRFQDSLGINGIPFLFSLLVGVTIIMLDSWVLGIGLILVSFGVIGSSVYNMRRRAPLRIRRHEARGRLHGYFADVITNNLSVKIFAREQHELKSYRKLSDTFRDYRKHDWTILANDGNNRITGILTSQILFVLLITYQVNANPELLSTGIFAFAFTVTLSNRLFEISSIVRALEEAITDAQPGIKLLEDKPELIDAPNAQSLNISNGSLVFRDVDFRYQDDGARALFTGLNFEVKPGEKIGLVGHSGGGKTTITKLLLRFLDIQGGEILIDGQNIAKVTQQSLREAIAYVPQEPLLFHRTLAENIAYGKLDATQKEIEKVAKLAHAHEFIKDLPDGYDTLVGERGVKLSGGQRQRVAIARAMLKNAPILVLDEATSALDSESEVLIQDALWKLMEGRTAIVIAHRLSTIQKMDRIIVMENGKIVEQGSHKELIGKKGTYAELWKHQSGGFIEE